MENKPVEEALWRIGQIFDAAIEREKAKRKKEVRGEQTDRQADR